MKYDRAKWEKLRRYGRTSYILHRHLPRGIFLGLAVPAALLLLTYAWIGSGIQPQQVMLAFVSCLVILTALDVILGFFNWSDFEKQYEQESEDSRLPMQEEIPDDTANNH